MDLPAAAPPTPYTLHLPAAQTVPMVLASPHSGRDYPAAFVAAARLDALRLRRSEDSFVDDLFAEAPLLGVPLLAANFPRAFCDANREAWELDPGMFDAPLPPWVNTDSARVGAGLGTIARVVASGEAIYRDKLSFTEAERRVRECWQPYHQALAGLIEVTRQRFGRCLLVDCHSMPSNGSSGRDRAEFVLGDAHGTSCTPAITRAAEERLAALGYRVCRNDPYAGGYITRHYGRPREGVHALQIEIARQLYMDEAHIAKLAHFTDLRDDMTRVVAALASRAETLPSG